MRSSNAFVPLAAKKSRCRKDFLTKPCTLSNRQYGPLAESLETCFFAEADLLLTGQLRNHRPNDVRNGYRAS